MKRIIFKSLVCSALFVLLSGVAVYAKSVTLSWDPSPSSIAGYKIYYDTQSAEIPFSGIDAIEGDSPIDVGNVLTYTVTGLYDDEDYYFAVTAYGADGTESTYSNVVASHAEVPVDPVVNEAPVLDPVGTQIVAEGSKLTFTINGSDNDGDTLSYSAEGLPAGASFDTTTRTFSWTPDYAETENTRIYAVTFTVSDGVATDSEMVSINVTNVNRAPVLDVIGDFNLNANESFSLNVSANDSDNNSLSFWVEGLPNGASFDADQQRFSWSPDPAQAGNHSVRFYVTDGEFSDFEDINLTVTYTNSTPVISGSPATSVMATSYYSFTPSASDVDGDNLNFTVTNKPSWASFDSATGSLYGSPSATQAGTYSGIEISVTDGSQSASLPVFVISVTEYVPVDSDKDGVPDSEDAFPNDAGEWQDTDGDRIGNVADTDDDNDGVADSFDGAPLDAAISGWSILAQADAGGYITPEGETYLNYGDSQSFELTAKDGYYVTDLRVNGASVGPVSSFEINGISDHYELAATFAEIPHGLSVDPVAPGLAGIDRIDQGNDSNNLVGGIPKLALDYRFNVTFREEGVTADKRNIYLVLDGYKYKMTLAEGALASGAEYELITRLGPSASHSFYFVAEDQAGNFLERYPENEQLAGPTVELLDGRNVIAIAADIDGYGFDAQAAFGDKQVQAWLPDSGPKGQFKLLDSVGPARTGQGYVIKRASRSHLPDFGSYPQVSDDYMEVPVMAGWNLIGNPYGGAVALADLDVQVGNGIPVPWLNAVESNIVVDGLYSYLGEDWGATNEFTSAAGSKPATLIPWIGYWVYINPAKDPVTLLIPKPLQ